MSPYPPRPPPCVRLPVSDSLCPLSSLTMVAWDRTHQLVADVPAGLREGRVCWRLRHCRGDVQERRAREAAQGQGHPPGSVAADRVCAHPALRPAPVFARVRRCGWCTWHGWWYKHKQSKNQQRKKQQARGQPLDEVGVGWGGGGGSLMVGTDSYDDARSSVRGWKAARACRSPGAPECAQRPWSGLALRTGRCRPCPPPP